jgi:hypothetical protein
MIIIFYEKHFFLLLYVIKVYCQTQAALDVAICFYQNFLASSKKAFSFSEYSVLRIQNIALEAFFDK